eukprot:SAG31_NODE_1003_length_10447_cov_3.491593_11_plen_241_part_00
MAFIERLNDVDAIEMSEKKMKQLAKHVTDEFTVEQVKEKSMAAALLVGWVMAFYEASAGAADGGEGGKEHMSGTTSNETADDADYVSTSAAPSVGIGKLVLHGAENAVRSSTSTDATTAENAAERAIARRAAGRRAGTLQPGDKRFTVREYSRGPSGGSSTSWMYVDETGLTIVDLVEGAGDNVEKDDDEFLPYKTMSSYDVGGSLKNGEKTNNNSLIICIRPTRPGENFTRREFGKHQQ